MSYYAVIDTNVLVSALLSRHSDSATVKVVERIFTKEVIPLFSEEIIDEYYKVLRRKKFGFKENEVNEFLGALKQLGELIIPNKTNESLPDLKDLPFYEVVLTKQTQQENNSYLVTGNMKHFPKKRFIVKPNEFLKIIDVI